MVKENFEFVSQKLRREYFTECFPYDTELAEIVDIKQSSSIKRKEESHNFLKIPLLQNMHIYLIEYLLAFCKKWFNKDEFSILDWGCGKCQVSYLLKKRGYDVVSCDIESPEHGDSAFGQYTPIANFAKINIVPLKHEYILPFEDNSFEIILSFGVLEHVANGKKSLSEINRVLKQGGLFFCFFLPCKYSWRNKIIYMKGNRYHDHFYNKDTIKTLLKETGFDLIDLWYRDVLPLKSKIKKFRIVENFDNCICRNSFLKYFASNIEFVSKKE